MAARWASGGIHEAILGLDACCLLLPARSCATRVDPGRCGFDKLGAGGCWPLGVPREAGERQALEDQMTDLAMAETKTVGQWALLR